MLWTSWEGGRAQCWCWRGEGPPTGTAGLQGRGRPWGEVGGVCFPFPAKMMALGNRLLRRFCWLIIKLSSTRSGARQGQELGLSSVRVLQEGTALHTRAGRPWPHPILASYRCAFFFLP